MVALYKRNPTNDMEFAKLRLNTSKCKVVLQGILRQFCFGACILLIGQFTEQEERYETITAFHTWRKACNNLIRIPTAAEERLAPGSKDDDENFN